MLEDGVLPTLAGLLHDLGKFEQHAELGSHIVDRFGVLFPAAWQNELREGIRRHHQPDAGTDLIKSCRWRIG